VTLRILLVDAPHLGGSATSTRLPGKQLVSRASQDTFSKKTLQFERKYSTQGSGAPCHVSFGFSFRIFRDFLAKISDGPSARARGSRLGGYSMWSAVLQVAPPYQLRLQDKTGSFLKTFEGSFRGRLGLLEKTSRLLKHQLEYIPASGCFDYS
jgi:hypothetical protein